MNSSNRRSTPEFYEYIFNWPALGLFVFFDLGLVILMLTDGISLPMIIVSFAIAFIYMNFFSLRIEVVSGLLQLTYGLGLFSSAYSQGDISMYQVESKKNLYSWFFNPQSEEVVVLRLRDGARKVIPSSYSRQLIECLRARS